MLVSWSVLTEGEWRVGSDGDRDVNLCMDGSTKGRRRALRMELDGEKVRERIDDEVGERYRSLCMTPVDMLWSKLLMQPAPVLINRPDSSPMLEVSICNSHRH